jgi:hypothetical protein
MFKLIFIIYINEELKKRGCGFESILSHLIRTKGSLSQCLTNKRLHVGDKLL